MVSIKHYETPFALGLQNGAGSSVRCFENLRSNAPIAASYKETNTLLVSRVLVNQVMLHGECKQVQLVQAGTSRYGRWHQYRTTTVIVRCWWFAVGDKVVLIRWSDQVVLIRW